MSEKEENNKREEEVKVEEGDMAATNEEVEKEE